MIANFPPFPEGLAVQDLLVVDYELLKAGDKSQANILWEAATTLGFWYLRNSPSEPFVEPVLEMGQETLALSLDEKMKYWQGTQGASFGCKTTGATHVDTDIGATDIAEFFNVLKDDALSYPQISHRSYPDSVNSRMDSAVSPFVQTCSDMSGIMLDVFNDKLGLPKNTLSELHRADKACTSEARCIKVPPAPKETKVALGRHTDFGSVSILFNRLGGLQIMVPHGGRGTWKYVKPRPGHAICNVGDALSILSGGILKSCVHRVVPPPGQQRQFEWWSLVYFARPSNDVYLEALANDSPTIAEAARTAEEGSVISTGMPAAQWFARKQSSHKSETNKVIMILSTMFA
ncbi:unnamed protein product [Cyclocybe aegerita]|uniref:Fe2OG dioxygenase domain-containing protein n=1 Tax=Cyclocybe aegerita TaxID=1973307 RepID=A0A8S0VYB2_CYCAE|nr:unnamed protein product [Cyclocybe aegerita]